MLVGNDWNGPWEAKGTDVGGYKGGHSDGLQARWSSLVRCHTYEGYDGLVD